MKHHILIKYLLLAALILCVTTTHAQIRSFNIRSTDTVHTTKWDYNLDIPFLLMAGGVGTYFFDQNYHNLQRTYAPNFNYKYDNYTQFAPAVAKYVMKFSGVKGRSTWAEMLTADVFSIAFIAATVNGLKYTICRPRPDGSALNSFPSGHTSIAFMTATMLHKEYGHISPWVSIGAYSCATLTGLTRQLNNRHWMGDVLMGAGIGIVCVELSYLVTDLIFHPSDRKYLHYYNPPNTRDACPSFVAMPISINWHLKNFTIAGNRTLSISKGGTIGIEGAWFPCRNWGVGSKVDVASYSYSVNGKERTDPLGMIYTKLGAYHSLPLNHCFRLESKALVGYGFPNKKTDVAINDCFNFTFGTSLSYWSKDNFALKIFAEYALMPNFVNKQTANEVTTGLSVNCMF